MIRFFYESEEKSSLILAKNFVRQSCSHYIFNLHSNSGDIEIVIHHYHCLKWDTAFNDYPLPFKSCQTISLFLEHNILFIENFINRSNFNYTHSLWGYLIFYSKYIPWSLRKKIFLGIRHRRYQNLRKNISSFHQCSFLLFSRNWLQFSLCLPEWLPA